MTVYWKQLTGRASRFWNYILVVSHKNKKNIGFWNFGQNALGNQYFLITYNDGVLSVVSFAANILFKMFLFIQWITEHNAAVMLYIAICPRTRRSYAKCRPYQGVCLKWERNLIIINYPLSKEIHICNCCEVIIIYVCIMLVGACGFKAQYTFILYKYAI